LFNTSAEGGRRVAEKKLQVKKNWTNFLKTREKVTGSFQCPRTKGAETGMPRNQKIRK